MNGPDIINGFKRINGRQMFVTKTQIAEAMGVKQTRSINWIVKDLEAVNGKYYFLTDVKNKIMEGIR